MEETFGKYKLIKKIAEGGMGEIYLARKKGPKGFSMTVVIKKMAPYLANNEKFVRMFLKEAKLNAKLIHPNIVRIHDFGKVGDSYSIEMEYIDGENLATIIDELKRQNLRMPVRYAVKIAIDICKGLDYAHNKIDDKTGQPLNIIHRDISPENIMISYDGEVKIADFGIAEKEGEKKESDDKYTLKGKFLYLSPEQLKGNVISKRSDIFSLGVLLYELVTGKNPFDRGNDFKTLESIKTATYPPINQIIPEIDEEFENIIAKALQKKPEERYQSAYEMRVALEDYIRVYHHVPSTLDFSSYLKIILEDIIEKKHNELKLLDITDGQTDEYYSTPSPNPSLAKRKEIAGIDSSSPNKDDIISAYKKKFYFSTVMIIIGIILLISGVGFGIYKYQEIRGVHILKIKTHLPEVEVYIGEEFKGVTDKDNPLTLSIPPGKKKLIKFSKECYKTKKYLFTSEKNGVTELSIDLEPGDAKLDIFTNPAEAKIFFDGKLVDGVTPLRLSSIKTCEEHTIKISKEGYDSITQSFVIMRDGELKRYSFNLIKTPFKSELSLNSGLQIISKPEGCDIYIDGNLIDKKTPANSILLEPGQIYNVRLSKYGFSDWEDKVLVERGIIKKIEATLSPLYGYLTVYTNPECDIYIDNKEFGRSSSQKDIKLPVGKYTVLLKRRDLKIEYKKVVEILPNQYEKIVKIFPSFLNVSVKDEETLSVYIDGEYIGNAPINNQEISSGERKILFKTPYNLEKEIPLYIKPGTTYSIIANITDKGITYKIK